MVQKQMILSMGGDSILFTHWDPHEARAAEISLHACGLDPSKGQRQFHMAQKPDQRPAPPLEDPMSLQQDKSFEMHGKCVRHRKGHD